MPVGKGLIKSARGIPAGRLFLRFTMSKEKASETPLMQQHNAIKARYPDAILLFRVGDFYETFGQDAIIAAQVLGITLTKRNNGVPTPWNWPAFRIMRSIPTCTNWCVPATGLLSAISWKIQRRQRAL
jgi:hypothetical protein